MADINFTGEESMDELATMLESMSDYKVSDEAEPDVVAKTDDTEIQNAKEGETAQAEPALPPNAAENEPAPEEGEQQNSNEQVVISKDGKHQIPFAVLEAERNRLKEEAQARVNAENQAREAKRQLELLTEQLNKAGIAPAQLPEHAEIRPEDINKIRELYPDVANVFDQMTRQVNYLKSQQQTAEVKPAMPVAVADAILSIPELQEWHTSNSDKFLVAADIDARLQSDPEWKDKTINERFKEATRRTKLVYGNTETSKEKSPEVDKEKVAASVNQKLAEAQSKPTVPQSPSDIGNTVSAPKSQLQQLAEANYSDLIDQFSNMTPEQIESILSQI